MDSASGGNQDRRMTPGKHLCFPLAQELLNNRYLDQHVAGDSRIDGAVKLSALMIDVIPELVDIPVATGFTGAKKSTRNAPPLVRQMTSEDFLSADEKVMDGQEFRDTFFHGPTSKDCSVDRRPCWRRHRRCGSLGRPCWRCHRRCGVLGRPC